MKALRLCGKKYIFAYVNITKQDKFVCVITIFLFYFTLLYFHINKIFY